MADKDPVTFVLDIAKDIFWKVINFPFDLWLATPQYVKVSVKVTLLILSFLIAIAVIKSLRKTNLLYD